MQYSCLQLIAFYGSRNIKSKVEIGIVEKLIVKIVLKLKKNYCSSRIRHGMKFNLTIKFVALFWFTVNCRLNTYLVCSWHLPRASSMCNIKYNKCALSVFFIFNILHSNISHSAHKNEGKLRMNVNEI